MNDDQIEKVFGALARIETKVDGTLAWMTKHVADDKLMAKDIHELQIDQAKQRGAAKVWNLLGVVGGALLGAAGGYFGNRH